MLLYLLLREGRKFSRTVEYSRHHPPLVSSLVLHLTPNSLKLFHAGFLYSHRQSFPLRPRSTHLYLTVLPIAYLVRHLYAYSLIFREYDIDCLFIFSLTQLCEFDPAFAILEANFV